ncbi:MAG: FAD-binding protein, partial [Ilumatobacteraceae bacterium]
MPAVAERGADRDAGAIAAAILGPIAERDVPLGPLTTYRVGGPADVFVRARRVDDLVSIAEAAQRSRLDVLVIGRGSNMLVADSGFRGIAVSLVDLADVLDIDDD